MLCRSSFIETPCSISEVFMLVTSIIRFMILICLEIRFEYLLPNVEPEQYSIGFDQQKEMEAQLG